MIGRGAETANGNGPGSDEAGGISGTLEGDTTLASGLAIDPVGGMAVNPATGRTAQAGTL